MGRLLILAMLLLSGCSTVSKSLQAMGQGMQKSEPQQYQQQKLCYANPSGTYLNGAQTFNIDCY